GVLASGSITRSSGRERPSRTAGRDTPAWMRARIGPPACRRGWPRRLLRRRRDAARACRAARPARALLLLFRRGGPRLRPDAHDLVLPAVGGVPGVVVEELPRLRVDEPADARRARGLARVIDDGHAPEQRRIRDALDGRRPRLDEPPGLADD